MPNNTTKANTLLLALAVLDAARIREESYDQAGADAASEAFNAKQSVCFPNFKQFYRKSLEEASEEAAIQHGLDGSGRLIYLALDGWWNDALEWAEGVKAGGTA